MPAIATHYIFINDLISKDDKYHDLISLAGQGPDPFFFYGFSFSKRQNKKEVQAFGTFLHHIDPSVVYNYMFEYVKRHQKHKEILLAFIKGFMFHYCLDRNAHPYIFYSSGFSNDSKEAKKYGLKHATFESYLDALEMKKHNLKLSKKVMLNCNDKELKIVSKMFKYLALDLFNNKYIDELSYYNGVKDMRFVYSFLASPLKIKKILFMAFAHNTPLNAMSDPLNVKKLEKYDIFNEKHNKWLNATNGNMRFESFFDLYENAKVDASKVCYIIDKFNNREDVKDNLTKFTYEINHDGFKVGSEKKYYKLKI